MHDLGDGVAKHTAKSRRLDVELLRPTRVIGHDFHSAVFDELNHPYQVAPSSLEPQVELRFRFRISLLKQMAIRFINVKVE